MYTTDMTMPVLSDPAPDLARTAINAFERILGGENVMNAVQSAATTEGERVCVEGVFQRIRENWPKVAIGGSLFVGGLIYAGFRLGRSIK